MGLLLLSGRLLTSDVHSHCISRPALVDRVHLLDYHERAKQPLLFKARSAAGLTSTRPSGKIAPRLKAVGLWTAVYRPCGCVPLQEARQPGTGVYTGLQETDDYIDDAMESYEASLDYPEA